MALSGIVKSIQSNHDFALSGRDDALQPLADDFKYEASDNNLQSAFTIPFYGIAGKDLPGQLKSFLYGDSSLHGSGYWNNVPQRVQPALDALNAAEKSLLADLPSCIAQLQEFKSTIDAGDISNVDLSSVNRTLKQSLRGCIAGLSCSNDAFTAIDTAATLIQPDLTNQLFDSWGVTFARILHWGSTLRTHQTALNTFYAIQGNVFSGNHYAGYPPFPDSAVTPRAIHYNLAEAPREFSTYYNNVDNWYDDMGALAQGINVALGNSCTILELDLQKFMNGTKQMASWDCDVINGHQYLLAQAEQKADTILSAALDLTTRLRGSLQIGSCIIQSLQSWKLLATALTTASTHLQSSLWKLYGNLFSADDVESALNWVELGQACQAYTTASDALLNASGNTFQGLTNAGDVQNWEDTAEDSDGFQIYDPGYLYYGAKMDDMFYALAAAQIDQSSKLVL